MADDYEPIRLGPRVRSIEEHELSNDIVIEGATAYFKGVPFARRSGKTWTVWTLDK